MAATHQGHWSFTHRLNPDGSFESINRSGRSALKQALRRIRKRAIRPWTSPRQGENYTSNLECGTRRIVFASPSDVAPTLAHYLHQNRKPSQGIPWEGFDVACQPVLKQPDPTDRHSGTVPCDC